MTSTPNGDSNEPSSPPPPRKTTTSRLSSFFGNRGGHINSYLVELEDPLKRYGPGDTVKGTVVVDVARALGVTHVVVCLYGFIQVFKNHKTPKAGYRNTGGRLVTGRGRRWVSEYNGDGYATLFEEEIVLCGEGRLDPNPHHFKFEIDFPSNLNLPTSVDFERGTISYVVSSTLTRPSSISATVNCDTRITYWSDIDVGTVPIPKPRGASLHPESFSHKSRHPLNRFNSQDGKKCPSTLGQKTSSLSNSKEEMSRSASPITSSHSSDGMSGQEPPRSSSTSHNQSSDASHKVIHTSVQLTKGGCVPGEIVPVRVSIHHHRPVRSLNGVIVTLYRQARVDMHPNIPIGPTRDYQMTYYPRSKTGLGGLSLSAAGSSQEWRKDLSQTFTPLFIDPETLSADLKIGIRIPDDVFPSINNTPGEMISFNYFVEVIIDTNGKLSGPDRFFPSLDLTKVQPSYGYTPMSQSDIGDHSITAYGSNCIDTSKFKRQKYVVTCSCELVMGTRDSSRSGPFGQQSKGKGKATTVESTGSGPQINGVEGEYSTHAPGRYEADGYIYVDEYENYYHWDGYEWRYYYSPYEAYGDGAHEEADNGSVPLPAMQEEQGLTEKERVRRHEARVLPSHPFDQESSSEIIPATAPSMLEELNLIESPRRGGSANPDEPPHDGATPVAVYSTPPIGSDYLEGNIAGDKNELERQRLQALASSANGPASEEDIPSAPTLHELDELLLLGPDQGSSAPPGPEESLPRYER